MVSVGLALGRGPWYGTLGTRRAPDSNIIGFSRHSLDYVGSTNRTFRSGSQHRIGLFERTGLGRRGMRIAGGVC